MQIMNTPVIAYALTGAHILKESHPASNAGQLTLTRFVAPMPGAGIAGNV
jgi:hypothetical protein